MKNILVTGGAGFIGSNLCEVLLDMGFKIINLDNFNDYYDPRIKRKNIFKALKNNNYTLVEGDIGDERTLDYVFSNFQIEQVVHLAALAGVRKSINSPLEYIDTDIKGTVNLLEYSNRNNLKKFIFASSSSVYGEAETPFSEGANMYSQLSPYAAAKQSGELFCRVYNNLYGLPVICLRFFTVYGARQRPEMAIYNFTHCIDNNNEIMVFGDGGSSRDYTYIGDIINGIIGAIFLDCKFEIFNLGNSKPIRLNYVINLVEKNIGKKAKIKYLGNQPGDVPATCADISKANALLGYNPVTCIEEGIENFIKWYREQN